MTVTSRGWGFAQGSRRAEPKKSRALSGVFGSTDSGWAMSRHPEAQQCQPSCDCNPSNVFEACSPGGSFLLALDSCVFCLQTGPQHLLPSCQESWLHLWDGFVQWQQQYSLTSSGQCGIFCLNLCRLSNLLLFQPNPSFKAYMGMMVAGSWPPSAVFPAFFLWLRCPMMFQR